jgi:hypothetical protein
VRALPDSLPQSSPSRTEIRRPESFAAAVGFAVSMTHCSDAACAGVAATATPARPIALTSRTDSNLDFLMYMALFSPPR